MCGAGGYSVAGGQGASFFCRPSLYGRYVTIRNTLITAQQNVALQLCEDEVYSARRGMLSLTVTFLLRKTCFVGLSATKKQGGRQLIRVKSQIVV